MTDQDGGYGNADDEGKDEQIESSDEYDPAHDIQEIPLSASQNLFSPLDPNNNASSLSCSVPSFTANMSASQNGALASTATAPLDDSLTPPVTGSAPASSITGPPSHDPASTMNATKGRLPRDTVGLLEDRIHEDEKGDLDAWLALISEYRNRGKLDDVRKVYDRFFAVFPHAAEQWVAFAHLENEAGNRSGVEAIFSKTLKDVPNLQLWCTYLDHIRRYYNIAVDKSGTASQTNHAAYEAVLDAVGIDKDSGKLWQDYIQFIKSGPGVLGQNDWQSQQKMDLLRKGYQRAICVPTQSVETIWKDYTNFEMSLNKMTGRQFLQGKSPDYMSARSSFIELQNITRDLKRTTLPILPPAMGFEGDVEYTQQVDVWKRWIDWEKRDPLVLKGDNTAAYNGRIIFAYKQALMSLRFWPEMWYEAAEFSFESGLDEEGDKFLAQGILANPESSLLTFRQADRVEMSTTNGNNDDSKQLRGAKVREPYDRLLDTLYRLITKAIESEKKDVAQVESELVLSQDEKTASEQSTEDIVTGGNPDSGGEKYAQIVAIKTANSIQISVLNRSISHVWITLMRAMHRMQGKGKVDSKIGGSRQIFTDSRKRGRITSEVWVAAAKLEIHNTEIESAKRIFERGMKLFPDDEVFALEYLRYLTNGNDHTNARAVFERTVSRLSQRPETLVKAKPLYSFFHHFECHYGELAQIVKLEKRMRESFPQDPKLASFSQRFAQDSFDPTAIRPVISRATQMRPKAAPLPSIEGPTSRQQTPQIARATQITSSPKRNLPLEDSESDPSRPRKHARGESPLAGAAGRRLNQLKQSRQPPESQPIHHHVTNGAPVVPPPPPPPPLPRDVTFLLSIIPPASTYDSAIFKADEMVKLLRDTPIPVSTSQLPQTRSFHAALSSYPPGPPIPAQPPYR